MVFFFTDHSLTYKIHIFGTGFRFIFGVLPRFHSCPPQRYIAPSKGSWQSDPGQAQSTPTKDDPSKSKNPFSTDGSAPPIALRPNTPFQSSSNPFSSEASSRSTATTASSSSPVQKSDSKNPFGGGGGGGAGERKAPPVLPPRRPTSPFQSRDSQQAGSISPRRSESAAFEGVIVEAVGLLKEAGRAVAALDDAYNAAYNASSAVDGWGGGGHDAAEMGEVGITRFVHLSR